MRGHRWFKVMITQLVLLGWAQLGQAQEATEGTPPATATVAKAAPTRPGPYFFHTNFAFNAYTHLGSMGDGQGPRAAQNLTPASRATIYQQLGFGYFFHPSLRVQLTLQVGETVSGLPANKDTVQLFGIIPWLVFVHRGFCAGAGPVFAPISANTVPRFDAGIFFATGYTFKLPHNFSLGALVQLATFFADRTTVAVSPAITAGYRM